MDMKWKGAAGLCHPKSGGASNIVINFLFGLALVACVGVAWYVLNPTDSELEPVDAYVAPLPQEVLPAEPEPIASAEPESLPEPASETEEAPPNGDIAEEEWSAALARLKANEASVSYDTVKRLAPGELAAVEAYAINSKAKGSVYWVSPALKQLDEVQSIAERRFGVEREFGNRLAKEDLDAYRNSVPAEYQRYEAAKQRAEASIGSSDMESAFSAAFQSLEKMVAHYRRELNAAGQAQAAKARYAAELARPEWDGVRDQIDSDRYGSLFHRPRSLHAEASRRMEVERYTDAAAIYADATEALRKALGEARLQQVRIEYDVALRDARLAKSETRWKDMYAALARAGESGYEDQSEADDLRAYWEEKIRPIAPAAARYNREVERAGTDLLDAYGGEAWVKIRTMVDSKWTSSSPSRIAETYDEATKLLQPVLYNTFLAVVKHAVTDGRWEDARSLSARMQGQFPGEEEVLRIIKAIAVHDLVPVADARYPVLDYEVEKDGFLFFTKHEMLAYDDGARRAQDDQRREVGALGLSLEVVSQQAGIPLRLVPSGVFSMGASNTTYNERPVHNVAVSRPSYFGKYEITRGQWRKVMGGLPAIAGSGADHLPITGISWNDCQGFMKKLCRLEGVPAGTYRLPTEAEWEFACRSGVGSYFGYGADQELLYLFGNAKDRIATDKKSAKKLKWTSDHQSGLAPVGTYLPNGWGLHDMHGNVWEWVQDTYSDYEVLNAADPCIEFGTDRVCRGGSFSTEAANCRSTLRLHSDPAKGVGNVGFRVVRTISPAFE
jgi:formylglycine-generating enzyme required for sulfatase activity